MASGTISKPLTLIDCGNISEPLSAGSTVDLTPYIDAKVWFISVYRYGDGFTFAIDVECAKAGNYSGGTTGYGRITSHYASIKIDNDGKRLTLLAHTLDAAPQVRLKYIA